MKYLDQNDELERLVYAVVRQDSNSNTLAENSFPPTLQLWSLVEIP
jgi:hypothetical protein